MVYLCIDMQGKIRSVGAVTKGLYFPLTVSEQLKKYVYYVVGENCCVSSQGEPFVLMPFTAGYKIDIFYNSYYDGNADGIKSMLYWGEWQKTYSGEVDRSIPISYNNGKIARIGDIYISTNYSGFVERIGSTSFSYDYYGKLTSVGGNYVDFQDGKLVKLNGGYIEYKDGKLSRYLGDSVDYDSYSNPTKITRVGGSYVYYGSYSENELISNIGGAYAYYEYNYNEKQLKSYDGCYFFYETSSDKLNIKTIMRN